MPFFKGQCLHLAQKIIHEFSKADRQFYRNLIMSYLKNNYGIVVKNFTQNLGILNVNSHETSCFH